jgi:hypothetical protein
MFIRRKPNKTGSVSVQVISKHTGKYQVVRSFGVGYSEQELVLLEERARDFISREQNFVGELFSDSDEVRLEDFISSIDNSHVQVVGPELIFGRLYDKIGYCKIKNDLFRHLVISRLFSPGSKLKTIDYLNRYHSIHYSIDKIYRFLDTLIFAFVLQHTPFYWRWNECSSKQNLK